MQLAEYFESQRYRQDMCRVHFLRTGHLNADLHDFLLSGGFDRDVQVHSSAGKSLYESTTYGTTRDFVGEGVRRALLQSRPARLILIPCCAGVPEPSRASLRYAITRPRDVRQAAGVHRQPSPRPRVPLVRCESVGDFSDAAPQRTAQRCFVLGKRQCTVLACDVARAVRRAAAARGDEL